MEKDNKPEETNPSVDKEVVSEEDTSKEEVSEQETSEDNKTSEEKMRERILSEMKKQNEHNDLIKDIVSGEKKESVTEKGSADVDTNIESSKSEDDSLPDWLKSVMEREYASIDDAKKHLSNLKGLVGDQEVAKVRKLAVKYNELVTGWAKKNNVTNEEAEKFLANQFVSSSSQDSEESKDTKVASKRDTGVSEDKVSKLEDEVNRLNLLMVYPEAKDYQEEISILAKAREIPWTQAYEQSPFKEAAERKAKEDSQRSPVVTPKSRSGFDSRKVEALGKKLLSYRGNESDAQELVTEVLGMK